MLLSVLLVLAISTACTLGTQSGLPPSFAQKAAAERDWWFQRTQKSKNGVVRLSEQDFDRLSVAPREFDVLLSLTWLESQCSACLQTQDDFLALGESNRKQLESKETASLFVAQVDLSKNHGLFRALKITSAPLYVVVKQNRALSVSLKQKKLANFLQWKTVIPITLTTQGEDALGKDLVPRVKAITGVQLSLASSPRFARMASEKRQRLLIYAVTGTAVFVLFWRFLRHVRWLYCAAALAVYFLLISGHMFNLIRETGEMHGAQWWAPGARAQTKSESAAVRLYTATAMFSVALLVLIRRGTSYVTKQQLHVAPAGVATALQTILPPLCLIAFAWAVRQLFGLYAHKQPGWNHGFQGFMLHLRPFFPRILLEATGF
ncbi:MAG: hypothetical protein MHM6MM_002051 [Cercozoa sp. M6MM]